MTRFLLLILVPLALFVPKAFAQSMPALKPLVSVSGDLVTLGDLIAGAGAKADIAVFRAPDLGQTGKVSVQEILTAASVRGLVGIATNGLENVTVTRASRVVTADDVRAQLTEAITASAGLEGPESLEVEIDPELANIQIPVEADGAVRIEDAVWLKEQGRFEANLVVRRIDGVDERRPLTGRAQETLAVVTAARTLDRGTVLTAADLQIEHRPKTAARNDTVDDVQLAAGMELRRGLREGQPLRPSDLSQPVLVKSGANISMVLRSGSLNLSASGQALADGKMGATIQVLNVQSKRVLQGVVTGPAEVTVQPPRTLVSAAK
jgi:flagella basal body P-ring formation protein FlgA